MSTPDSIEAFIKRNFLYWITRKAWFSISVWVWRLRGEPVPPPHPIKRRILREYAKRFSLGVFIETGTYFGDMVGATIRDFNEIFSIELDRYLYLRARRRFAKFPHVHILQGDSSIVLANLLAGISRPCLFWLDAHLSDVISARGELDSPIMEELRHIFNHGITDNVILIDDARHFVGRNGYPTLNQLRSFVERQRADLVVQVAHDIIRIHSRVPRL